MRERKDRGRRTARGGMREIDYIVFRQPRIGVVARIAARNRRAGFANDKSSGFAITFQH